MSDKNSLSFRGLTTSQAPDILKKSPQLNTPMSYDWSGPVNSLLNTLQKDGYTIVEVFDGGEWTKFNQTTYLAVRKEATDIITSVDECHLRIKKGDEKLRLFIVLGNEPEEIVADYISNDELEVTLDKYIAMWEGKKCPTK